MSGLILCSDAVAVAVDQGLSVKSAVGVLRSAIDNVFFAVWARRHVTPFATEETVSKQWVYPNDRSYPLEVHHVPYWLFPEVDEEGFGIVSDESGEIIVITAWLKSFFAFNDISGTGSVSVQLRNVCFDDLATRSLIAANTLRTNKAGRKPLCDYQRCRDEVLSQIINSPRNFQGRDERIRQNSDNPQQRSVIAAAREWCEQARPGFDPPSDDALRRNVANKLESDLRSRGFNTWRTNKA